MTPDELRSMWRDYIPKGAFFAVAVLWTFGWATVYIYANLLGEDITDDFFGHCKEAMAGGVGAIWARWVKDD